MAKVPQRYIPKSLSKKSRKKQIKELKRSRKSYKKGKYYTRKKVKGFKSKRTGWAKKVEDIYGLPKNKAISIAAIQRKTRCKKSALNKIIKKGMGAYYSSGSRPNQTAHSWGKARLYSAISGGPAARVDMKILEEGCPKNSKTLKLARKAKPIRKTRKTKIGGDGETKNPALKDELLKLANEFAMHKPLINAISNSNLSEVKNLLDKGANVNYVSDNNYPLKRAWELEDIDMIKLLIKNGAYVNIELDDKEWASGPGLLHDAVERARPDLVEILLEAKDISAARKGEIVFFPPDGFTWDTTPEQLLELYISNTGDEGDTLQNLEEVRDVFKKYDKQIDDEHRALEDIMPKKLKRAASEMTGEVENFLHEKWTPQNGGKNKMKEKIIKFEKSKRKGKKYMVIVENKKTDKQRILHFGATGYEQFKDSTPLKLYSNGNHGDPKRRKNYFNRHSGTPNKRDAVKKESRSGLYTPKLLSHIYLW